MVAAWPERLAEVPTDRSEQPEIGRTQLLGQEHVKLKFDVMLPVPVTTGDFEEMPWLMGQGVGLVHEVMRAAEIVSEMMQDAAAIVSRLSGAVTSSPR